VAGDEFGGVERMKILILGGTAFLGRHLVNAALECGHELTLFNRGQTDPDFPSQYPQVNCLQGDRDSDDLNVLKGQEWDAVIDTSAYVPRVLRQSLECLVGRVKQYVFISTISVYSDFSVSGVNETSPTIVLDDPLTEEVGRFYGGLKALCEEAVLDVFGPQSLIVRPGLIVGPHDPTDRFTYWPHRIAKGGEVLVPDRPNKPFQAIDARDLAKWIIESLESGLSGNFNLTGPAQPTTMGALFETCQNTLNQNAKLTWVDNDFLLANEVGTWIEMPFWIGGMDMEGLLQCDCTKANATGLHCRPLAETIRDTYVWSSGRAADYEWKAGLSESREQEILEKFKQQD
jgi:2'-hydroxyisoflavone reductase